MMLLLAPLELAFATAMVCPLGKVPVGLRVVATSVANL